LETYPRWRQTGMSAFFTLHRDLPREGPGEPADVAWAMAVADVADVVDQVEVSTALAIEQVLAPPPDDVPALEDNTVAADLSVRARLAQHRANPACASCHDVIDPIGFSLENFDAVGRWREVEGGVPINAEGGLPDGSRFNGVAGLEQALLGRPEMFVGTLTEKLMTYALGRGLEHDDAPAVRTVVRESKKDNFRFSSLVLGIVTSPPFQMRTSQ